MKKFCSLITALAICLSIITMPVSAAENVLYKYDTYPGAVESNIKMKVNGEEIFVEDYKDISYGRFAFEGVCQIEITPDYTVTSYDISPHSFNIKGTLAQNTLSFSLDRARKIIIDFNNGKRMFVFADDPEENAPKIGDEGVYNLMDYEGIDNTGTKLITEKIQAALDDVSYNHPGGTLFVPNGKYLSGIIRIRSNTTVYLESGAIIQGTSNAADYPRPTIYADGNEANLSALICFDVAENSKLTGRGTIDGDGKKLRQVTIETWLINLAYSKNCVVEDLILRDPSAFGAHIMYSDDITFQRTKQIHDLTNPNTDGIDPDCSRNILIDDCFSYCSDDSVSVKSNRYSPLVRNVENITVSNNVFWTLKSALKIGDETMAHTEKNIKFINNDIVRADRAIVLYVSDGSTVSNVQWINNRSEFIGGDTFRRLVDIWIKTRDESMNTPGKVEDLLIKDFYAEQMPENTSLIEGFDADHLVQNVYFDNFVVAGKKMTNLDEAGIMTNAFVNNIVFGPAPEFVDHEEEYVFTPESLYMDKDGYVTIEAENYHNKVDAPNAKWAVTNEAEKRGALNDGCLRADVFTADTENVSVMGRTDYRVKFFKPGTYYIWLRLYAKDMEKDFVTVGIDGVPTAETGKVVPQVNTHGWYWSDSKASSGYARISVDSPGIHTINVWTGTNGMYLDKIVLYANAPGNTVQQYNSPGKKGMGMPPTPYTDEISVRIDGTIQSYEVKPLLTNNRVMLPFRAIFEKLGAAVDWNEQEQKVTANKMGTVVEMTVDNDTAYKNGTAVTLDSAPIIVEERTLVPVRFVGEMLDAEINWDSTLQLVDIKTKEAGDGGKVEAELMSLNGFSIKNNPYIDGSVVVDTDYVGHAKFIYKGESGLKSIQVYCYAPAGTKSFFKLYAGDKIAASGTVYGKSVNEPLVLSANGVMVQNGDPIILESVIASGEAPKFDYVKIFKGNLGTGGMPDGPLTEGPAETVFAKIEAENMELNGYDVESIQFASNLKVVRTDYIGTAKTTFDGEDGTYTLKVAYFDENDGAAQYRVLINNKEIKKFDADADLGNASPITETLDTKYIVTELKNGDVITIEGTADGGEPARFDYLEILFGEVKKESTDSGKNPSSSAASGKVELEKTTLVGLTAESISGASGGMVVRTDYKGTASFKYGGADGTYTIHVAYYDENDGAAKYKLTVAGKTVDEWTADEDKGNASPVNETKVIRSVSAKIKKGDEITLECTMDGGEPARADYIEIK